MYEIDKKEWTTCKVCGDEIKKIAKKIGGSGVYYTQVFQKHIKEQHNITLYEYFGRNIKCPCGICNKDAKVICNNRVKFEYGRACGRAKNQDEVRKKHKKSKIGNKNPMFGKKPWNKDLSKKTNDKLKIVSNKMSNRKVSDETKKKQSIIAKNREVSPRLGKKHSLKTINKLRELTLARIKNGQFQQNETLPVKKLTILLKKLNIKYEREKIVSYWSFDFYLPDYSIYIEVDGDYWHSNPLLYPNGPITKSQKINFARDISKNTFCKNNSLNLVRFWEFDINNNIEEIECTLKKLLK